MCRLNGSLVRFITLLAVQEDARRLEMPIWLIAFERYALGAQAVDHQLSFQQALVHSCGDCLFGQISGSIRCFGRVVRRAS